MKEARRALEHARPELLRIQSGEHRAEIEKAMAHAREQMKVVRFEKIHSEAIRTAMAQARINADRVRFVHHGIGPEKRAEIQAALDHAQKELERFEVEVHVPDIEAELERELGPVKHED